MRTKSKRGHRGNIWKRGRVWWIAWTDHTGNRHRASTRCTKKADAQRMLDEIRGRLVKGEPIIQKRITLDEMADNYINYYRLNKLRSIKRAELSVRHLTRFFGGMEANAITTRLMRVYVVERQGDGAADATIQIELAALSKMFNLSLEEELLTHAPKVPRMKINNARTGFFEEHEFRAILKELPDYAKGIAVVGYYTGWRVSEILGLTWRQIEFDAGMMRLEPGTTKNDDGRTFPFSELPELAQGLRDQRDFTTAYEKKQGIIVPYVFHRNGHRIKSIRKGWIEARQRAGMPEKKFHDFRRTAARNLERANVPRTVAKQLMGHRTDQMYERYAITTERDQRDGVKRLVQFIDRDRSKVLPLPSREA